MRQEAAQALQLFEDLEAVQRHCEQYFPVPDELTPTDQIALRMTRLLIEGHCVISPFLPQVRCTLNCRDSPAIRALLSGEPHALQGGTEEFAIDIGGRRLELGPVVFFHTSVIVGLEDGAQALAALDTGRGDGHEVTAQPTGGQHFRLMLRSAITGADPTPTLGYTRVPRASLRRSARAVSAQFQLAELKDNYLGQG